MILGEYIKRLLCPSCIEMDAGLARRNRMVSTLERSGDSLDRLAEQLSAIRQRMAADRNPLLGSRTERDSR